VSQVQLGLLSIRDLTVIFARDHGTLRKKTTVVEAVKNISLDVHESESVSILGETGSGKTTLGKCIVKLLDPTSGSIFYGGTNIHSLKGKDLVAYRRDVQMIFQDPYGCLNPRQDVLTILSTPFHYLSNEKSTVSIKEKVYELMEEVGLRPERFAYRYPHELSGGERQRVNIARAFASNPKVLVADEPMTMLDATQRIGILNLIRELKEKRNLAVILITHDLASAKVLGGRTVVMYQGRMVEEGPVEDVFSNPHHPYVELIRNSTPELNSSVFEKRRVEFASGREMIERAQKGCVFRPRCKYATSRCEETHPELIKIDSNRWIACYNPLNAKQEEKPLGAKFQS
jgi:peptide/nickel transport system ATP-binding protein